MFDKQKFNNNVNIDYSGNEKSELFKKSLILFCL